MGRHSKSQSGFTIVELMIVVAIIGVLSAVAIVGYRQYAIKARNAEATSVLADVRLKEEAYRATFHQYASIPAWVPDNSPTSESRAFLDPSASYGLDDDRGKWQQLGAVPDGQVYFSYYIEAGAPGAEAGDVFSGVELNNGNDFWFAARALQDLDDDGEYGGFEIYSGGSRIADLEEGQVSGP